MPFSNREEPTILFNTATRNPVKKEWIRKYIDNRAGILQARPPKSILQSPPALVHKLAECVSDIINNPEHFPEANVAILKLSTPLEWAAELYWHTTDNCRALCARTKAPKDLAKYAVEKLSDSFTVYLAFVDNQLYPGSGTQVKDKSNNGGRRRQLNRSLTRAPTSDHLHKAILLAHEKGLKPAQWVQAVDIRVPKLVDGQWTSVRTDEIDDVDVLLHYRVLAKLGEHCFGCLLGRNKTFRRFDRLLWPVSWKPLGPWPAFQEYIQGVMTRKARNARRRVENLTDKQRERKNFRQRVANMTEEKHETKKARQRMANMTDRQLELLKARKLRARLKKKAKRLALAEKTRSEMNEENAAGS